MARQKKTPVGDSQPLNTYGDAQRIEMIFAWFVRMILIGMIAGVFIVLSNDNFVEAIILGVSILPVLIAIHLIRKKRFELAAAFVAMLMIAILTLLSTRGQGIHSIPMMAFPAILIIASLVIRKRTMALLALFSLACVAWLVFGELGGVYAPKPLVRSVPGDFFSAALILIATAVMVRLITEALFQSNRRLQQELRERKQIEIQRERLIAELEAKNAELERFTYTVSHDLKAPLITIAGFIGHLQADLAARDEARLAQDSRRISEAVGKMRRLLDELLELSRIGRLMNPPETVPFADLASEALKMVHGRLEERGIRVSVQPGLPMVRGDRQRLAEVLQNLIDNAAKFMGDQPDPRIEIGCERRRDEAVFFVRDNGIGIDSKFHEQVFGLFTKLDAHTEGTGVGLALVKRIIEVHGGRIWVESETGKGATFYFTIGCPAGEEVRPAA